MASLHGQELLFQRYTIHDGLTHVGTHLPNSILKDKDGFVWFSTLNGLSRFDGKNFKNYIHNPNQAGSIPDNTLTVLGEDEQGNLWVGSAVSGIFILDKATDIFTKLEPNSSEYAYILDRHIYFIEKDKRGNMWFGGELGVAFWDKEAGTIIGYGHGFKDVHFFLEDKDGTIWLGDGGGLHRKSAAETTFTKIPLPGGVDMAIDILQIDSVTLWVVGSGGRIWALNTKDLFFRDLEEELDFEVTGLRKGHDGRIWLRNSGGIMYYDPFTKTKQYYKHNPNQPLSLPSSTISDMMVDSLGNIFVITWHQGIGIARIDKNPFEVLGDFNCIEVLPIGEDLLLIRDFIRGGILYDVNKREEIKAQLPVGPGNIYAPSMALRGDSLLWIWDPEKISSYHLKTKETRVWPKPPVQTLYIRLDQKGRVWNGLSYLNEESETWTNILPELTSRFPDIATVNFTYANIYFDNKNDIWISLDGAKNLIQYNLETKKGELLPMKGLPFGGERGGVCIINSDGFHIMEPGNKTPITFTSEGGLNRSIFHAVEDKDGNLWLSTGQGVQLFDKKELRFKTFTYQDGFPWYKDNLVNRGVINKAGFLYFTKDMKTVFRIHPDNVKPYLNSGKVYLDNFYLSREIVDSVNNQTAFSLNSKLTESILLDPDQNDFGFSFTMPIFYKANEVQYYYMLEPYHKTWISNGTSNIIHFTNISPGNYTFRVRAMTSDGIWSTNDPAVQIAIAFPWWQTWWAGIIFGLIFISLLWALRNYELSRQTANTEAKRLLELNNIKSQLYTNITHEFRTPLTIIMGMTENIKGHENEKNLIIRNSKNLLRLIVQLLDLSKLDSGSMGLDLVHGDIISYLRYLTESFYSMARDKQISLTYYSEEREVKMDFDENKMQHIIYNLLSNAIKYTEEKGKIILHVKKQKADQQDWLIIKVQDNGRGIPSTQLPFIFDRFYQVDATSTRKGEGTGVGLALTKELVELMGGAISVASVEKIETVFEIKLPIQAKSAIPRFNNQSILQSQPPNILALEPHEDSLKYIPQDDEDRPSILIIEDNRDVKHFIISLLGDQYAVITAKNGQEGIDMAFEIIPDIIISDVMMPEKDGFEVCQSLKTDLRTSHIPIILLTAKAEQADRNMGLKYGADAYLIKPFDKEELLIRIEKLLDLRKSLQARFIQFRNTHEPIALKNPIGEDYPLPSEETFLTKLRIETEKVMEESDDTISLLQKRIGLSQMQLYRKLKAITGQTPSIYIRTIRLQKARELLTQSDLNISEIAYKVGFNDPAYFSRAFKEEFGIPPSEFRNK